VARLRQLLADASSDAVRGPRDDDHFAHSLPNRIQSHRIKGSPAEAQPYRFRDPIHRL
jgi:hypothetical protein